MKFGLKLWSINTNLIDQAVHLIYEKVCGMSHRLRNES